MGTALAAVAASLAVPAIPDAWKYLAGTFLLGRRDLSPLAHSSRLIGIRAKSSGSCAVT
jgi:hypothetical protein